MKLSISVKSGKPAYEQLYDQIASDIINGILEADYCLPSIRAVAKELGISVITVKNAYEMLENAGFIYTRAGVGCFVLHHAENSLKNKKTQLASNKLKKDIEYYKNLGLTEEEFLNLAKKLYQ